MSEIISATYGPLIDGVGGWSMGIVAFYWFCRLIYSHFHGETK